ncbi:transposable element Tcb1 transposase [Trichonephila clavipes]|nr:transposable element Tcb1 transposase [Trichonephila clavipes]
MMNFHNLHTGADENPHAIRPHGAQRKCSINMGAAIVGDCLLGPYILPERLNGSAYLTFLQEVLPEMLNDVPMPIRQRIRFQHDGAPAHFSIDVRAHLQATFPGGWIGFVYETPVATPEDLVGKIVEAAGCVRDTPGIFEKVRCSMQRRCQACLDASGKNFEHLLSVGSNGRNRRHLHGKQAQELSTDHSRTGPSHQKTRTRRANYIIGFCSDKSNTFTTGLCVFSNHHKAPGLKTSGTMALITCAVNDSTH